MFRAVAGLKVIWCSNITVPFNMLLFCRLVTMAADNNNNNGSLDLTSFKEQFEIILLSKSAPYKRPKNRYQHSINCLAVIREEKRYDKYEDLKRREFPQDEIQDLIERAFEKVTKETQPKISTFFPSVSEGHSSATSENAGPSVSSDVVHKTKIG